MKKVVFFALGLALATVGFGQGTTLKVDLSAPHAAVHGDPVDVAVRSFAARVAALTARARQVRGHTRADGFPQFSMPVKVLLTRNGQALPSALRPRLQNAITLAFDSTGQRAFPPAYQAMLQSDFDTAVGTINAVFGPPSASGTVYVRNYDADIADRDAVAGGVFLPNNGQGQAEIRFPVYLNDEATAVNFIHTVLLAYLGADAYGWDAFQEGLVRAATMKIVRTPGALPSTLDPVQIENVLELSYDVGSYYDWYNQRALAGPVFIAPNLLNTPLPVAGSVGGLYLLRYEMAGSAWQKVLTEYPAFISTLNASLFGNPAIGSDRNALVAACQQTMDTLGGNGATVEGLSFPEWFRRQYVLDTHLICGQRLLSESVPITSGLGNGDFGVFLVQANYFQTLATGDEILGSATCFPIFWDPSFNRIFPSSQEAQMSIAGGYGSVVPNFPDLTEGIYRVAVDLPVQDENARVYLPAGAIATGTSPSVSDFFGTVENAAVANGDSLSVQISYPGSSVAPIPVNLGAFGTTIGTTGFLGYQTVTVQVVLNHNGSPQTLMTRVIDKGPGPLAVDLNVDGEGTFPFPGGLPAGASMPGLPIEPFASYAPDEFNTTPDQLLLGRYNQTKAQYDLFPDTEAPTIGHGYVLRLGGALGAFAVDGRWWPHTPMSVALKPGWNMVSSPLPESVPTTSVEVIRSTGVPLSFAAAQGGTESDLGIDFFTFVPGANDPASGVPETGSLVPAASFDPGKAYYVRVLAPEGVTLLFLPSSPLLGPYLKAKATTRAQTDGWDLRLDFTGNGRTVSAHIGASSTATSRFDGKEDSGMPPGIGGFQATVVDSQPLFRDIRELGQDHTYTVRVDGLVKGKSYQLNPVLTKGDVFRIGVTDTGNPNAPFLRIGQSYSFVASGPSRVLKLTVRGNGR